MDVKIDDWKKNVGFPINYDSGQSSDDDFDTKDVVMRNPRHSSRYLLADGGDGAEADLLGTTPPRSRIRDKEKRRNFIDSGASLQKPIKEKDVVDYAPLPDPAVSERLRKRSSLKLIRSKERDYKLDISHQNKADSLPSPNPAPAVPTLVESCSRFMSLSSRPKCRMSCEDQPPLDPPRGGELPASRVNFHKTFSMLINMGNMDKGCRRTISREEQVWQNELKDLIWLELQAKIAGRTLAQQDAYLCAQRKIVPTVVENILQYRFVNPNPCPHIARRPAQHTEHTDKANGTVFEDDEDIERLGCLILDCEWCSSAVGRALREVGGTLDAFYNATALYPSTQAMTHDHPTIATARFNDTLKAMCLWYNTALHLRLKMAAVRLVLRSIAASSRRPAPRRPSLDSDVSSRQSSEGGRTAVRFSLEQHTPSSTNSDERPEDDPDSGLDSMRHTGQTTPEIVVDSPYSTATSDEADGAPAAAGVPAPDTDPFDIGALEELTVMRLLNKCDVSMYRVHHQEILKTQGVRRSMTFMNKMRENVLRKVHLTLDIPHNTIPENEVEDPVEMFHEARDEEPHTRGQEDEARTEELRRYGCWSQECRSMRLPSYRAHFLLLSAICMEAVHDYLSFRLETRPERPSCLTVKQLMHELKEGLDIASEMRVNFVRNLRTALGGRGAGHAAADLLLLVRTFDTTVTTMLQVYLSYLTTMSEKEAMPRGALQAEWRFTARLARRIKCAHHLAPNTFSTIVCNQLKRLLKSYNDKFDQLGENPHHSNATRHGVYAICRAAQNIFASEREHTLQAAQWARALAARLARAPPPAYLKQREEIFNSLMAVRDYIVQQVRLILAQSREAFAEEVARDVPEPVLARVRELLLQTCKLAFEIHKELHGFVQESVNRAGAGARRSLASPSRPPRGKFVRSDSVIEDYDTTALEDRLFDNIAQGDNQTQNSIELLLLGYTSARDAPHTPADGVDDVDLRRGNTTESCEEEVELRVDGACVEQQWAARVARAVIDFAQCWMSFVLERCDKGRGLRPRWASQGLEFLMLACDPCNTKHLSEEEFEELKHLMDGCISHVIGCRRGAEAGATPSPRARHRLHSPFSSSASREAVSPPAPPSPQRDEPAPAFNGPDTYDHSQRVMEAISKLEAAREAALVHNKSVGRVVAAHVSYEMKLKQLSFKWQRGLKIGAGTFGKVYTVVNTESGQLLAMKELSIAASDRRAFQRAANELRVLEGVIHPHLVRYYGAELHREEMLIFMELCVEGSLEALVATSGALAEHTVRRYTRQLLSAVLALHARSIAHRDIKSGNIFLTNEGHCLKLGDFGCAVKIRANTTAPNELQGFVGTQAYMAPEVFMKSSGHGRAADIWSVGCVVTEMASGKRPFSEYDSNYQIMFRVGMGARPHIPAALSDEGRTFCEACLTHEPAHRPRAQDLTLHSFLLVNSDDDDCKCEPAYLIT